MESYVNSRPPCIFLFVEAISMVAEGCHSEKKPTTIKKVASFRKILYIKKLLIK